MTLTSSICLSLMHGVISSQRLFYNMIFKDIKIKYLYFSLEIFRCQIIRNCYTTGLIMEPSWPSKRAVTETAHLASNELDRQTGWHIYMY